MSLKKEFEKASSISRGCKKCPWVVRFLSFGVWAAGPAVRVRRSGPAEMVHTVPAARCGRLDRGKKNFSMGARKESPNPPGALRHSLAAMQERDGASPAGLQLFREPSLDVASWCVGISLMLRISSYPAISCRAPYLAVSHRIPRASPLGPQLSCVCALSARCVSASLSGVRTQSSEGNTRWHDVWRSLPYLTL